ncbi:hypothetical protein WM23_07610 [Burkholderia ubonensis]|nr:hypothetical protein WM23_07610 [Burkholderia ubonensis]
MATELLTEMIKGKLPMLEQFREQGYNDEELNTSLLDELESAVNDLGPLRVETSTSEAVEALKDAKKKFFEIGRDKWPLLAGQLDQAGELLRVRGQRPVDAYLPKTTETLHAVWAALTSGATELKEAVTALDSQTWTTLEAKHEATILEGAAAALVKESEESTEATQTTAVVTNLKTQLERLKDENRQPAVMALETVMRLGEAGTTGERAAAVMALKKELARLVEEEEDDPYDVTKWLAGDMKRALEASSPQLKDAVKQMTNVEEAKKTVGEGFKKTAKEMGITAAKAKSHADELSHIYREYRRQRAEKPSISYNSLYFIEIVEQKIRSAASALEKVERALEEVGEELSPSKTVVQKADQVVLKVVHATGAGIKSGAKKAWSPFKEFKDDVSNMSFRGEDLLGFVKDFPDIFEFKQIKRAAVAPRPTGKVIAKKAKTAAGTVKWFAKLKATEVDTALAKFGRTIDPFPKPAQWDLSNSAIRRAPLEFMESTQKLREAAERLMNVASAAKRAREKSDKAEKAYSAQKVPNSALPADIIEASAAVPASQPISSDQQNYQSVLQQALAVGVRHWQEKTTPAAEKAAMRAQDKETAEAALKDVAEAARKTALEVAQQANEATLEEKLEEALKSVSEVEDVQKLTKEGLEWLRRVLKPAAQDLMAAMEDLKLAAQMASEVNKPNAILEEADEIKLDEILEKAEKVLRMSETVRASLQNDLTMITGVSLDAFSRGARIAKYTGEQINELRKGLNSDAADGVDPKMIDGVLKEVLEKDVLKLGLLNNLYTKNDPHGILLNARIEMAASDAAADSLVWNKTAAEIMAQDKSIADYLANWGRNKLTYAAVLGVVSGALTQSAESLEYLVSTSSRKNLHIPKLRYLKILLFGVTLSLGIRKLKNSVRPGQKKPSKEIKEYIKREAFKLAFRVVTAVLPGAVNFGLGITLAGFGAARALYRGGETKKKFLKGFTSHLDRALDVGGTFFHMGAVYGSKAITEARTPAEMRQPLAAWALNRSLTEKQQDNDVSSSAAAMEAKRKAWTTNNQGLIDQYEKDKAEAEAEAKGMPSFMTKRERVRDAVLTRVQYEINKIKRQCLEETGQPGGTIGPKIRKALDEEHKQWIRLIMLMYDARQAGNPEDDGERLVEAYSGLIKGSMSEAIDEAASRHQTEFDEQTQDEIWSSMKEAIDEAAWNDDADWDVEADADDETDLQIISEITESATPEEKAIPRRSPRHLKNVNTSSSVYQGGGIDKGYTHETYRHFMNMIDEDWQDIKPSGKTIVIRENDRCYEANIEYVIFAMNGVRLERYQIEYPVEWPKELIRMLEKFRLRNFSAYELSEIDSELFSTRRFDDPVEYTNSDVSASVDKLVANEVANNKEPATDGTVPENMLQIMMKIRADLKKAHYENTKNYKEIENDNPTDYDKVIKRKEFLDSAKDTKAQLGLISKRISELLSLEVLHKSMLSRIREQKGSESNDMLERAQLAAIRHLLERQPNIAKRYDADASASDEKLREIRAKILGSSKTTIRSRQDQAGNKADRDQARNKEVQRRLLILEANYYFLLQRAADTKLDLKSDSFIQDSNAHLMQKGVIPDFNFILKMYEDALWEKEFPVETVNARFKTRTAIRDEHFPGAAVVMKKNPMKDGISTTFTQIVDTATKMSVDKIYYKQYSDYVEHLLKREAKTAAELHFASLPGMSDAEMQGKPSKRFEFDVGLFYYSGRGTAFVKGKLVNTSDVFQDYRKGKVIVVQGASGGWYLMSKIKTDVRIEKLTDQEVRDFLSMSGKGYESKDFKPYLIDLVNKKFGVPKYNPRVGRGLGAEHVNKKSSSVKFVSDDAGDQSLLDKYTDLHKGRLEETVEMFKKSYHDPTLFEIIAPRWMIMLHRYRTDENYKPDGKEVSDALQEFCVDIFGLGAGSGQVLSGAKAAVRGAVRRGMARGLTIPELANVAASAFCKKAIPGLARETLELFVPPVSLGRLGQNAIFNMRRIRGLARPARAHLARPGAAGDVPMISGGAKGTAPGMSSLDRLMPDLDNSLKGSPADRKNFMRRYWGDEKYRELTDKFASDAKKLPNFDLEAGLDDALRKEMRKIRHAYDHMKEIEKAVFNPTPTSNPDFDSQFDDALEWIIGASSSKTKGVAAGTDAAWETKLAGILKKYGNSTKPLDFEELKEIARELFGAKFKERGLDYANDAAYGASATGERILKDHMDFVFSSSKDVHWQARQLFAGILGAHILKDGNGRLGRTVYAIELLRQRKFRRLPKELEDKLHGLDDWKPTTESRNATDGGTEMRNSDRPTPGGRRGSSDTNQLLDPNRKGPYPESADFTPLRVEENLEVGYRTTNNNRVIVVYEKKGGGAEIAYFTAHGKTMPNEPPVLLDEETLYSWYAPFGKYLSDPGINNMLTSPDHYIAFVTTKGKIIHINKNRIPGVPHQPEVSPYNTHGQDPTKPLKPGEIRNVQYHHYQREGMTDWVNAVFNNRKAGGKKIDLIALNKDVVDTYITDLNDLVEAKVMKEFDFNELVEMMKRGELKNSEGVAYKELHMVHCRSLANDADLDNINTYYYSDNAKKAIEETHKLGGQVVAYFKRTVRLDESGKVHVTEEHIGTVISTLRGVSSVGRSASGGGESSSGNIGQDVGHSQVEVNSVKL